MSRTCDSTPFPVPFRRDPTLYAMLSRIFGEFGDTRGAQVESLLGRLSWMCPITGARHLPLGVRGVPVSGVVCILSAIGWHLCHTHGSGMGQGRPCLSHGNSQGTSEEGHTHWLHDYSSYGRNLCKFPYLHALYDDGGWLPEQRSAT